MIINLCVSSCTMRKFIWQLLQLHQSDGGQKVILTQLSNETSTKHRPMFQFYSVVGNNVCFHIKCLQTAIYSLFLSTCIYKALLWNFASCVQYDSYGKYTFTILTTYITSIVWNIFLRNTCSRMVNLQLGIYKVLTLGRYESTQRNTCACIYTSLWRLNHA